MNPSHSWPQTVFRLELATDPAPSVIYLKAANQLEAAGRAQALSKILQVDITSLRPYAVSGYTD